MIELIFLSLIFLTLWKKVKEKESRVENWLKHYLDPKYLSFIPKNRGKIENIWLKQQLLREKPITNFDSYMEIEFHLIEAPFLREKPLLMFDSYMEIEFLFFLLLSLGKNLF